LLLREKKTSNALREQNLFQQDFTSQISLTTANYALVIDYSLRNHCEHLFLKKQKQYNAAKKKANQILMNNKYFSKWCQGVGLAIWLIYGGLQVIAGSMTVGIFITNLQLFKDLGTCFGDLYELVISMMNVFPAIVNVTTLMNHPTDVRQRYLLEKGRRAFHKRRRSALRIEMKQGGTPALPVDLMPIVMDFQDKFKFEGKDQVLNFQGRVEIQQGQLVAVVGPLGCGKATLLRLVAGSVLPEEGRESAILMPAHLRVANVADEALFFGGTLYENLIFGMHEDQPDASRERVASIVRRLTKSHEIASYLDSDAEESWQDIFSGAQCKLLGIARALIHNAEVLCIHKPLAKLTHDDAEHVVQALHDHLDNKGMELASDPVKRRPRTVFVSAATSDRAIDAADNVVLLDSGGVIQALDPTTGSREVMSPAPQRKALDPTAGSMEVMSPAPQRFKVVSPAEAYRPIPMAGKGVGFYGTKGVRVLKGGKGGEKRPPSMHEAEK